MRSLWKQLPQWVKNPYLLLGLGFLLWMLFFDAEDLITQYKLKRKVKNLVAEKEYYLEQIARIRKDREELASNKDLLEKFAREKYFMKKKTEDLYIIVDDWAHRLAAIQTASLYINILNASFLTWLLLANSPSLQEEK